MFAEFVHHKARGRVPVFLFFLLLGSMLPFRSDQAHGSPGLSRPPAISQSAASTWVLSPVDEVGSCFDSGAGLALDPSGVPHISYNNFDTGALHYARQTADGWDISIVDARAGMAKQSSIALDRNNFPSTAYRDGATDSLKFSRWDGVTWHVGPVGLPGEQGWYSSLRLDGSDQPHISYLGSGQQVKYAHLGSAGWEIQFVDAIFTTHGTSLAIDSEGGPHISYQGNFDLRYAHLDGLQWITQTLEAHTPDHSLNYGAYSSIELDSRDQPHISYASFGTTIGGTWPLDLKYAHLEDSTWITTSVVISGNVGFYSSLELDQSDRPHISYYDQARGQIRYIFWDGAGWQDSLVASLADIQYPVSLALDQHDRPRMAFCSDGTVWYAWQVSQKVYLPIFIVSSQ